MTGLTLPKVRYEESGLNAIVAAGLTTWAHGLGVRPDKYGCKLECSTAQNNWAVGERQDWGGLTPSGYGVAVWADATNVYARMNSNANPLQVLDKTSGGIATVAAANFKLVLWAEK